MKKLKDKTKISVIVLLGVFFLPLSFLRTTLTSNINLNLISKLHLGDFNMFFGLVPVSSPDYITVKSHKFVDDLLIIDYLSSEVVSPVEGIVLRRGNHNGNNFLIIQSNNHEYIISGLRSIKVFVFSQIKAGDILGAASEIDGQNRVFVQNLTSNDSFLEIVMLLDEYEEI